MMRQHEQGWRFTDKLVCTNCVDDDALKAVIVADEDTDHTCDFCGHSPAAPLDTLLEAFVKGLKNEYRDADDEGVSWDGREGGYQWGRTWRTYELVDDFADVLVSNGLVEAVQDAMDEITWVEENFASRRRDEVLNESWDRFCETVKYETRYVIWLRKDHDEDNMRSAGEVPPALILDEVGRLIGQLDVLRTLPAGYRLWRARTHDDSGILRTAAELGTAPREHAKQANRMSPAGISMFYGAEDVATAIQEVAVRTEDDWVTFGLFETSKECTVVDFTNLRPVPSMFDPEWGGMRRFLLFLHRFRDQLSAPARSTYEQIDYVPTQIVTEYLLRIFGNGALVDGLLYASALTGRVSAVLDVPASRCAGQVTGWDAGAELRFGLVQDSVEMRKLTSAEKGA